MDNLIPRLPVTKALRTLIGTGTGKPCGLMRSPRTLAGKAEEPPYYILYPLWTRRSGSWGKPEGDAEFNYQVKAVTTDPVQVEWLYDKVLEVLFDRDTQGGFLHELSIAGLSVMTRRLTDEDGGFTGRDLEAGSLSYDVRFVVKVTRE